MGSVEGGWTLGSRVYILMYQVSLRVECISYKSIAYKDCFTIALMILFFDLVSRSCSESLKSLKSFR